MELLLRVEIDRGFHVPGRFPAVADSASIDISKEPPDAVFSCGVGKFEDGQPGVRGIGQ